MSESATPYRVLARKYRPRRFSELIGQDAMVQTLGNAIRRGRLAHAFLLTGVRGVGKTSTARLIAKALNCVGPDGRGGPTIDPCGVCEPCVAIAEGRHIDVIEMDAASHTGVDDMREIIEASRLAAFSARYKIYIIDEVHMLSEKAFNAFLKTLEEPPEHAKFVFATTEIRKVPITVLSRCQRFDLRRVDADVLMSHLANIAQKENVGIEAEALGLVARAAEGSVRDSLSLLDQAIAHAAGQVRADDVRQMLGLADRARVIDLFEHLAKGDIASAFKEFREQYDVGADPVVVLSDLAEFVNFVTRVKVVPATADNLSLGETERTRGREFAAKLSMRVLSRMWQMLLKGIAEVQGATRPQAAAEMVLVRIAYAADLPTPDEAIRMIDQNGGASPSLGSNGSGTSSRAPAPAQAFDQAPPPRAMSPSASRGGYDTTARAPVAQPASDPTPTQPQLRIGTYAELIALAGEKRDLQVKSALEADLRLVRMDDGRLEVALEPHASRSTINDLARKLEFWTGRRWTVIVSNEAGQPTLRAQAQAKKEQLTVGVHADPRVQAVMTRFPGAQVIDVRSLAPEPSDDAIADDGLEPDDNDDL